MDTRGPTFYTVADRVFFPGAAALVNSLRLTGNDGTMVVLDCGLEGEQRRRLERVAEVVAVPDEVKRSPYLVKPFPARLEPRGVVVLIDSDMIVTRSLEPALARARAGKICLHPETDGIVSRRHESWADLFGLQAPLRFGRYRNAGFVALSVDRWPLFLERWWEAARAVPSDRMLHAGAPFSDPLWGGDQDAMNALLLSEVPADAVEELPFLDAPRERWLRQVRILDEATLRCALGDTTPSILHYTGSPKPWQPQGWMRVRAKAFERLLARVLLSPDVAVPLEPSELPPWLRPGPAGSLLLHALSGLNGAGRLVVRGTRGRTRARLATLRKRLSSLPSSS